MRGNWFRQDIGSRLAERTALMAAIASTGRTFGRSLMPRTTVGQAVATGLTGSVNYGLVVTSQSALWAGASMLAPALMPAELPPGNRPMLAYRSRVRLLAYGTYGASAAAAAVAERALQQRPGESAGRAVARSVAHRTQAIAAVGLIGTGVQDVAYSVLDGGHMAPRTRRVVGAGLILAAGAALATAQVQRQRQRAAEASGETPPRVDTGVVLAGA